MGSTAAAEPIYKVRNLVRPPIRSMDVDQDLTVSRQSAYPTAEMSNQSALRMAGASSPRARVLRPSQNPILQHVDRELATADTAPPVIKAVHGLTPKAQYVARQPAVTNQPSGSNQPAATNQPGGANQPSGSTQDIKSIDQQIAVLNAKLRDPKVAMSSKAKGVLIQLLELGKQRNQLLRVPDKAAKDGPLPTLPPGETWANPDLAHQYLRDYDQRLLSTKYARIEQTTFQDRALQERQTAIAIQDRARADLDDIMKNDIWPNWGTLNHVLTVGGVLISCLDGACVIGLATGALSFLDTDSGAIAGVITSCIPDPLQPGCATAVSSGAASMAADRKDKSATTVRLSAKETAQRSLELGKKAQAAADAKLKAIQHQMDLLDDEILFLESMYNLARFGNPKDSPINQVYKTGVLI